MEEDIKKAVIFLNDIKTSMTDVSNHIQGLIEKVNNEEISTSKGVSFLEVKYQMLLSYLVNLTYVILNKVSSQPIEGDPAIDRLVEIRTVLEKMRPIEHKLKYQVDKLITTATTGITGPNDPLRFRANPDNMESKFDESDGGSNSDNDEEEPKTKLYRPPKLAAVHYDGDDTVQAKKEKVLERAKKRALSSSIMKDLRDEHDEGPIEVKDTTDTHRAKEDRNLKERTKYEEDYFIRMSLSKKEQHSMKRLRTLSSLNELTHFADVSALTGETGDFDETGMPSKKQKTSKKGKGKGKKKGRKWKK